MKEELLTDILKTIDVDDAKKIESSFFLNGDFSFKYWLTNNDDKFDFFIVDFDGERKKYNSSPLQSFIDLMSNLEEIIPSYDKIEGISRKTSKNVDTLVLFSAIAKCIIYSDSFSIPVTITFNNYGGYLSISSYRSVDDCHFGKMFVNFLQKCKLLPSNIDREIEKYKKTNVVEDYYESGMRCIKIYYKTTDTKWITQYSNIGYTPTEVSILKLLEKNKCVDRRYIFKELGNVGKSTISANLTSLVNKKRIVRIGNSHSPHIVYVLNENDSD